MKRTISVIYKAPGKPAITKSIPNTLEELQANVEGVTGALAKPGGLCNPERGGGLSDTEGVAGTWCNTRWATSSVACGDSFPSEGKPLRLLRFLPGLAEVEA